MRIGLSADWHLACHRVLGGPVDAGVNLRCRLIGEAGARMIARAAAEGCDRFAILGDLFDRGKPSPEEIGVAAKVFADSPIPVYVIPGNHDRSSDEPGNNALAALVGTKNCIVVDEPTYLEDGVILAPFSPRPPVEYFAEVLRSASPGQKHLLGHVGIVGLGTPDFMAAGRNIITVEEIFSLDWNTSGGGGFSEDTHAMLRSFCSGDFHRHEIHDGVLGAVNIVQVGALCQANFGDPPEVGRLCILDTDKGGITEIYTVPGPRFLTEAFADLKRTVMGGEPFYTDRKDTRGCDIFLSVTCATGEEQEETRALLQGIEMAAGGEGGDLCGWKTELAQGDAQRSEVVEAVRGSVQVEEALQEWAAAQPVDEAVRERAVQIALECLR